MNSITKLGLTTIGAGGVFGAGIGTSKLAMTQEPVKALEEKTVEDDEVDWERVNVGEFEFLGPTIGETLIGKTGDTQWRFLYLLAGKVFDYLKHKQPSISESDILDLMKSKLKVSSYSGSEDWEKFKSICTKAIKDEDEVGVWDKLDKGKDGVGRLCFMGIDRDDSGEIEGVKGFEKIQLHIASKKGDLSKLKGYSGNTESGGSSSNLDGFSNWKKTNYQLWKDFKTSQSIDESSTNEGDLKNKFGTWFSSAVVGESDSSTKISEALKTK